jgi:hypothetical protein
MIRPLVVCVTIQAELIKHPVRAAISKGNIQQWRAATIGARETFDGKQEQFATCPLSLCDQV